MWRSSKRRSWSVSWWILTLWGWAPLLIMGILGRGFSFSPWSVLLLYPSLSIDNTCFTHQWPSGHWTPNGPHLLLLWAGRARVSWCVSTWNIKDSRCLFSRDQHHMREIEVWRLHNPVRSWWPTAFKERGGQSLYRYSRNRRQVGGLKADERQTFLFPKCYSNC